VVIRAGQETPIGKPIFPTVSLEVEIYSSIYLQ